jgi:hypothetical protein
LFAVVIAVVMPIFALHLLSSISASPKWEDILGLASLDLSDRLLP